MTDLRKDTTIKQLRSSTALTQAAFADRYGIPRRTIEDWETGKRQPPGYVIDLLTYRIAKEKEDQP